MKESQAKPVRKPIRLRSTIFEYIDKKAAYMGLRTGTLANRILEEELDKVKRAGIDHCVRRGSKAYENLTPEEQAGKNYYVIPAKESIEIHMPNRGEGDGSNQVSFYMTEAQLNLLEDIVRFQNIKGTVDAGKVLTLRYAVVGLLLNNEVLSKVYVP